MYATILPGGALRQAQLCARSARLLFELRTYQSTKNTNRESTQMTRIVMINGDSSLNVYHN